MHELACEFCLRKIYGWSEDECRAKYIEHLELTHKGWVAGQEKKNNNV